MTLIKATDNSYINIDYITRLILYENQYWCNVIGEDNSVQISAETYNKLVEKYGRL